MRKSNWIVAAIAAVACGVLLWAWFALGFNHVDDPLDLVVAIVWWLAVAAVVGGIVWAEGKRREKMRLAFVGEGVVYNPEAGLVMPDAGESELAALERTLSGMAFPDEVAALDERVRPALSGSGKRSFPCRCGSGASSGRFATSSRSARGTDRDIPASFLRSRSSRVDPPSMKQGGSHERRHARVQRLAYVRSFDDG